MALLRFSVDSPSYNNNRDTTECGINTNVYSTNTYHTTTARISNDLQNNIKISTDPGYVKTNCCRYHYEN